MKTLILSILLLFSIGIRAQVNFSSQVNGLSATFSITQAGQYYEFIKWSFGDGTFSNGGYTNNQVTHIYSVAGTYSVCVIGYPMPIAHNDTACKSISVISTGIHANTPEDQVSLFPNPVKDKLSVTMSNSNTALQLTVTTTLGKTVYELDKINDQQAAIDLGFLSSGIYLVKIQTGGEQKIFKIVKE